MALEAPKQPLFRENTTILQPHALFNFQHAAKWVAFLMSSGWTATTLRATLMPWGPPGLLMLLYITILGFAAWSRPVYALPTDSTQQARGWDSLAEEKAKVEQEHKLPKAGSCGYQDCFEVENSGPVEQAAAFVAFVHIALI
eukprot:1152541-Pelagomonas_calceolata.AAC.6